jgi:hypothetical protein
VFVGTDESINNAKLLFEYNLAHLRVSINFYRRARDSFTVIKITDFHAVTIFFRAGLELRLVVVITSAV